MPILEPKHPLKVFLCHASTDKPKVRELYRYLKKRGIQPWFDEEDLVGGQDWQVEIPKALATSDAIIICLTKNSVDKEGYVQNEIKFALDKALGMPEGRIFLIPVKFEECEVPFSLSRYQWVDLTIESGYAKMMKALKFRASQLERSTVEVSKKDVEEENLAREKTEREAAKKAAHEKETAERERLEFEEQIKIKAAEEKAEREASEQVVSRLETTEKPVREKQGNHSSANNKYFVGGVLFIVLVLASIFGLPPLIGGPEGSSTVTVTEILTTPGIVSVTKTLTAGKILSTPTTTKTPTVTLAPTITITSTITLTPAPLLPEITDERDVSMILVSAGEFDMGYEDDKNYIKEYKPVHIVYLDSFYIDKYEVTNVQYKDCVNSGACTEPRNSASATRSYYYGNPDFDDYPVIYVDWNQSRAYCEWRGGNLPTEAQWEKSARGTDGRYYPWGSGVGCSRANYCENDTNKIGSYASGESPYGIHDLIGNVAEWTGDWYSENYYQSSPYSNPLGPESGMFRVVRGGAWVGVGVSSMPIWGLVLPFERERFTPDVFSDKIGFRCVKDVAP